MKTLNFYNEWHLGDCLYTIHYFNKLAELYPEAKINFYCNPKYHFELILWIQHPNISLFDVKDKPVDSINTWIGEEDFYWKNLTPAFQNLFDHFYVAFFEMVSAKAKVSNPIETVEDMLFDNPRIISSRYVNSFDYLIINSKPLSGQVDDTAIKNLNEFVIKNLWDFKVISTDFIPNTNIQCTLSNNLSLMDIAGLSCNCDNIIGIHTAPYLPCFNTYNIDKVKNWIIIQRQGLTYSFNDRIKNIKHSSELTC